MDKKKKNDKQDILDMYLEYSVDFKNRIIHVGEINSSYVRHWIKAMKWMEAEDAKKRITFIISSYGGSVYDGLGLYDMIRTCKCPITTIGNGKVMSMGTFIMCAGNKKYAHKHTTFMFHELSGGSYGKYSEMQNDQKENARLMKMFSGIYSENSNKDVKWWKKFLAHTDKFMSTDEVEDMGMLDKVL